MNKYQNYTSRLHFLKNIRFFFFFVIKIIRTDGIFPLQLASKMIDKNLGEKKLKKKKIEKKKFEKKKNFLKNIFLTIFENKLDWKIRYIFLSTK